MHELTFGLNDAFPKISLGIGGLDVGLGVVGEYFNRASGNTAKKSTLYFTGLG
jgi:hypothetical protein